MPDIIGTFRSTPDGDFIEPIVGEGAAAPDDSGRGLPDHTVAVPSPTPQTPTGKRLYETVMPHERSSTADILAIEAEAIAMLAPLVAVVHEEDDTYSIEIAAMPGHIGADDSIAKAAVQAHDAAISWLESYREVAREERERLLGSVENEVAYYFDRGHFRGCAMLDTYLDQKDCDCGPLALADLLAEPEEAP